MAEGKTPMGRDDCDITALNKNKELARKLNITGTPTIFFGDGERVPGAMPLARIEQKLRQVKQ
jgi:thiol:disulfide interchange protein DsbC